MTDPVGVWLPPRIPAALEVNGIRVIVLLVRLLAVGIEKGEFRAIRGTTGRQSIATGGSAP
jgi:hypothetical protein